MVTELILPAWPLDGWTGWSQANGREDSNYPWETVRMEEHCVERVGGSVGEEGGAGERSLIGWKAGETE